VAAFVGPKSKLTLKGEWRVAALLIFFLTLGACHNGQDGSGAYHPKDIGLTEISGPDCLNLQKYLSAIRGVHPSTRARYFTTNFDVKPYKDNQVPAKNFILRAAFGSFMFTDTNLGRIGDLATTEQTGCETVTLGLGSKAQSYKIIDNGPDFLTIENEWDERRTYRWLSPTQMSIRIQFPYGDFLCNAKTQSYLTVIRDLSWGEEKDLYTGAIDASRIDDEYLALLLDATGITREELIADDESNLLDVSKLKQLLVAPVRPELLECR
jgi:hypothetical protein